MDEFVVIQIQNSATSTFTSCYGFSSTLGPARTLKSACAYVMMCAMGP